MRVAELDSLTRDPQCIGVLLQVMTIYSTAALNYVENGMFVTSFMQALEILRSNVPPDT